MKVSHLCTSSAGGAAVAALRLHTGLKRAGVDSSFLVGTNPSELPGVEEIVEVVHPAHSLRRVKLAMRRILVARRSAGWRAVDFWSTNLRPRTIAAKINKRRPGIVNLHWVGDDFIPIEEIGRLQCPLVWTLHDMWPFTGGCHYSSGCLRFQDACGECAKLRWVGRPGRRPENDLSEQILAAKAETFASLNLTIVSPTKWLADKALQSRLFRNKKTVVIAYGLPLETFKPLDRGFARDVLGLPRDKRLVLFGAVGALENSRKGYAELKEALERLPEEVRRNSTGVVFGSADTPVIAGMETRSMGVIRDEVKLALVYSACDISVTPSLEDNSPNTILEAMACGLPVVAFGVGGIPELVRDERTGLVARSGDREALSHAILRLLSDATLRNTLGAKARRLAEEQFADHKQAAAYRALYEDTLVNSRSTTPAGLDNK